ncbi:MAG TPA: hypothetical protein VJ184_15805 [Chryseolinea sp.]|nr:hypothetical protein [Chryseolinea sp.]
MRLYHSIAVFLIFLVSILSLKSQAQSAPALSVGQMVKQTMKESWADIEPLGQDDQGVYYMAIPYTEVIAGPMIADADFYFFLVNDAAELVKRNPVNFMVDGRESHYEFTEQINGKVIIFTSVENKKEKKVSFYSLELDKKNLQVTNPKKVVELSFADVKRDYERATFKSQISRDKSKLLISYGLVDNEGSMLKFGYVVLNSLMKETFKWSGNLDMSDGVYRFDQFRISNKGEVYLQTRYFKNEKAHDKNVSMKKTNLLSTTRSMEHKKNYEHRIVKFENNGTKIIPIPNKERFYEVFDLEVAPDGNLVLIGFYSPLEEEKMPVGAACIKVNVKTGAVQESAKEFGNSFDMPSDISIKNNGLAAGKDQYLKYRFIVSDIHFNKNGGYTLIGERNVTQTKRVQNTFYTVNHLDDLAVVDVSAAGVVTGSHKVEKSQQAEDLQLFNASYYYAEHNNNRYIAFANLGKGSFRESILVTIGPDGKQRREVMFNTKDAEVTIKPKDCELFNGKLVMYGSKNNRYVRWITRTL